MNRILQFAVEMGFMFPLKIFNDFKYIYAVICNHHTWATSKVI